MPKPIDLKHSGHGELACSLFTRDGLQYRVLSIGPQGTVFALRTDEPEPASVLLMRAPKSAEVDKTTPVTDVPLEGAITAVADVEAKSPPAYEELKLKEEKKEKAPAMETALES